MGIFSKRKNAAEVEHAEKAFALARAKSRELDFACLHDEEFGVYHGPYFEFRLNEEMARSVRRGDPFALIVVLHRGDPNPGRSSPAPERVRIAQALTETLRAIDLVAVLDGGVFAACLINCGRSGANEACRRLSAQLGGIPHSIGVSLFPDERLGADELITLTRRRAAGMT